MRPLLPTCEDCNEAAYFEVVIRLRVPNKTLVVGRYCERHAEIRVAELHNSLPDDSTTAK